VIKFDRASVRHARAAPGDRSARQDPPRSTLSALRVHLTGRGRLHGTQARRGDFAPAAQRLSGRACAARHYLW
jgi:hypothetical protein